MQILLPNKFREFYHELFGEEFERAQRVLRDARDRLIAKVVPHCGRLIAVVPLTCTANFAYKARHNKDTLHAFLII